jgi:cell wall-associated NlpC family hydrolase
MPRPNDEVARRARSLIGTRFRPQGRGRDGIDCVGVAAFALGLPAAVVRRDYALRGAALEDLAGVLRGLGLAEVEAAAPGDIAVFVPGPAQLHLGVVTAGGAFVHADLGLKRVVERPLPAPWPSAGLWRLCEE